LSALVSMAMRTDMAPNWVNTAANSAEARNGMNMGFLSDKFGQKKSPDGGIAKGAEHGIGVCRYSSTAKLVSLIGK